MRMAVVNSGKWARTHLAVEEEFNEPAALSLVKCNLETGRTHQIRVHLAAVGHPVVGDSMYGGAKSALVAPRPMLHARMLTLIHPGTGEEVSFTSEPPRDMQEIIERCSFEIAD
jgi:23S rRNA pseudouridine1911/1915/1917 synthase